MAEGNVDKTLAIKITPKLDVDALTQQIKQAVTAALGESKFSLNTENEGGDGGQPRKAGRRKGSSGSKTDTDETDETDETEDGSKKLAAIKAVGTIAKTGFNLAQQTFNGIFGIIKEIHARVKQSSAFLATVENLFNLAVTLLLMPLGNAIADVILPSTIELVDKVVGLWEEFEKYTGKGDLRSIVGLVMQEGMRMIGDYLKDLGKLFTDTGDTLLGSIGSLFTWLGNLLETGKLSYIVQKLFDIFKIFADNIGIWIPMIIGYQTAQLGATIAGAGLFGSAPAAAAGAAIGFSAGAGISYAYLNHADGGVVPHTSGGQMIRVAEHEDEIIMPKSQFQSRGGGGNTYYYTINGFTTEEVKQIVRDVISDEISNSQYRSGL